MTIKLTRVRVALATAVAAAIGAAGVSYAAIPAADGAISACKDSKGRLKVIDAEAGQTCNGGQQLLTWNQQGPAGQDGVSGYQVVHSTSSYDSVTKKSAIATCPSGKKPVGGGVNVGMHAGPSYISPPGVAVVATQPTGNGWGAVAKEIVPTDEYWEVTARAICVTAF